MILQALTSTQAAVVTGGAVLTLVVVGVFVLWSCLLRGPAWD